MKLSEFYDNRKSDTVVYLGSAESINNITPEQWEKMDDLYDTFALNNWVYHPYIPHFYHLELKTYNKDLWARRFKEKKAAYLQKECKFVIRNDKKYLAEALGDYPYVYYYKINVVDTQKVVHKDPTYPTNDPNVLSHMGQSSMSVLFDLFRRMGYKRIVMFGVDYTSSRYFWTGRPEFGETHCQTNKDHEGHDPNLPHATLNMIEFVTGYSKKYIPVYVGYEENIFFQQKLLDMFCV
jgi:hypothetical protein